MADDDNDDVEYDEYIDEEDDDPPVPKDLPGPEDPLPPGEPPKPLRAGTAAEINFEGRIRPQMWVAYPGWYSGWVSSVAITLKPSGRVFDTLALRASAVGGNPVIQYSTDILGFFGHEHYVVPLALRPVLLQLWARRAAVLPHLCGMSVTENDFQRNPYKRRMSGPWKAVTCIGNCLNPPCLGGVKNHYQYVKGVDKMVPPWDVVPDHAVAMEYLTHPEFLRVPAQDVVDYVHSSGTRATPALEKLVPTREDAYQGCLNKAMVCRMAQSNGALGGPASYVTLGQQAISDLKAVFEAILEDMPPLEAVAPVEQAYRAWDVYYKMALDWFYKPKEQHKPWAIGFDGLHYHVHTESTPVVAAILAAPKYYPFQQVRVFRGLPSSLGVETRPDIFRNSIAGCEVTGRIQPDHEITLSLREDKALIQENPEHQGYVWRYLDPVPPVSKNSIFR